MRFIIFIAGRIRHGQFPRLPDFPYSEKHGLYIYQGRELDADEFNTAAGVVFDPHYRNNGFTFQPRVVLAVDDVAPALPVEETPPAPEAAESAEDNPFEEQPSAADQSPSTSLFTIQDDEVFHDDIRVATILFDGTVRMARGHSTLRADLEAWLKSNPIPLP